VRAWTNLIARLPCRRWYQISLPGRSTLACGLLAGRFSPTTRLTGVRAGNAASPASHLPATSIWYNA
jgi:hypothetical protein